MVLENLVLILIQLMLARSVKLLRAARPHTITRAFSFNVMGLISAHAPTQEQPYLTTVRLAGEDIEKKKELDSLDL